MGLTAARRAAAIAERWRNMAASIELDFEWYDIEVEELLESCTNLRPQAFILIPRAYHVMMLISVFEAGSSTWTDFICTRLLVADGLFSIYFQNH